jgi:aryl-alcohol dehydrogenase-like predicted oxidoreductase
VAWTLRQPAIDGAIVGYRGPDQIDPILAAAKLKLTDQDLEKINGEAKRARQHRPPGPPAPSFRRR